ncbi:MAG: Transposase family protein [Verrucomicrobiales bacterium]|nr:Transposase family protein [Verrucomicrobiales bacterium]
MKQNTNTHKTISPSKPLKTKCIKLGIDVHADSYRVVRQIDNATPQPAQKFTPKDFLLWAKKQLEQAEAVYSCYEAGPMGYSLHRALEAMGIHNVVVRPVDLDELHKGVKTDNTDARALVLRLDRYVQGNRNALAIVKVPTPAQELARSQSRQREQLLSHCLRLEAQGRSLLLFNGVRLKGRWWQPAQWNRLEVQLAAPLLELLRVLREVLLAVDKQLQAALTRIQEAATPQPKGVGALTSQVLEREILCWDRFENRRQVASMTGMCPGVRSSGNKSRHLSITKHGNRRMRTALIELAWRWVRFQPDYQPVKKCMAIFKNPKATGAAKKKAIVAVGRHIAIDLWRLNTGRTSAEKLCLC